MTRISGRTSRGIAHPRGKPARSPRQPLDSALIHLRYLLPFAAPRLPDVELACFDQLQRQIKPLPGQTEREWYRRQRRNPAAIPQQRRPHPLEQRREQRRAPR